ncbi:hypothetical protein VTN00DRAFT_7206 [Thermoascus crustaceus]|uniref:uncharacterized protein n=1 Tax=Thermoascus crustaceus TaxID=5088 RepID=UPI0037439661
MISFNFVGTNRKTNEPVTCGLRFTGKETQDELFARSQDIFQDMGMETDSLVISLDYAVQEQHHSSGIHKNAIQVHATKVASLLFDQVFGETQVTFSTHAAKFGLSEGRAEEGTLLSTTPQSVNLEYRLPASSSSNSQKVESGALYTNSERHAAAQHTAVITPQESFDEHVPVQAATDKPSLEPAEPSPKRPRLETTSHETRSPDHHSPKNLSFIFISPRMEGILERRSDKCDSAEKLFEYSQTIFGFFDKAREIRCLICKIKDGNRPPRYILDQSEDDFQLLLEDVQKTQTISAENRKVIEVRLVVP